MRREKLQGERVYYHADPDWPETQVCWQPCSDCLSGMIRYEDEEEAERVLAELRH